MKAVILAAGEGTRLRPHTATRPKCLVEVCGRPLLLHQISALNAAGISDITVVTGYRSDLIDALGLPTIPNPDYASSNMVTSLMCAAEVLDGASDVVIAYGDLLYEPRVVEALCACEAGFCTTVDRSWRRLWESRFADPLCDAETMKLGGRGEIIELGKRPGSYDDIEGQYMGLTLVRAASAPVLVNHYRQLDPNELLDGKDLPNIYMTSFLQSLIDSGHELRAVQVNGGWLEVDSVEDLELYEQLHQEGRLVDYCRLPAAPAV